MTAITLSENHWNVTGDILMDNANALLEASHALDMVAESVVDFAQVAEVDTSAVSLMLEWMRRAEAEGKQVTFVNLPKNLTSLTTLYGVEELFN